MNFENLIKEALCLPTAAIKYHISLELARVLKHKAIIEGDSYLFDLEQFARARQCSKESSGYIHNQFNSEWSDPETGLMQEIEHAWFEIHWQGYSLEVLAVTVDHDLRYWIIADIKEIAETFYVAVCEWNLEVRGELLVFERGCWHKDEQLYRYLQKSTLENLVLPTQLKQEIEQDARQFFSAKATYEEYGIPWKRGILLIGPPGNGKTETIKVLANMLGQQCLYVKSFKSEHHTEETCIQRVFSRARKTTPCFLIFEDLDALITDKNRAFFLNELDGFTANTGIMVIATTNHPDKLDPAIINRPSRFDRKYHFNLPAPAERLEYVRRWNQKLQPALRLSAEGLEQTVNLTDGFSFAYLKELFVSSMMNWINRPQPQDMDQVVLDQIKALREQMSSPHPTPPEVEAEED